MKIMGVKRKSRGFSYIEVLIATILIAIVIVPAINALHTGVKGTDIHLSSLNKQTRLKNKMEDVLAQTIADLQSETGNPTTPNATYSDGVGTPNRRLVYVSEYDGDNLDADNDPFTGTDPGLIWVRVEIENTTHNIQTLTSP